MPTAGNNNGDSNVNLHFKFILAAIVLLASSASNAAQIYRYTYTGAPEYEMVLPGMPAELTSISGYIDLAGPLASDFSGAVDPLAYSFTDGITTITESSGYLKTDFIFQTDIDGGMKYWFVHMDNVGAALPGENYLLSTTPSGENTSYCGLTCDTIDDLGAFTTDFEGSGIASPYWTLTVVPIPAAAYLFVSGLGLLGWFRRRQTA